MSRGARFDIPPHAMKKVQDFYGVVVEIVSGTLYADLADISSNEKGRFSMQCDFDKKRFAHFRPYQLQAGNYFSVTIWRPKRGVDLVELRSIETPPLTEEKIRSVGMTAQELWRNRYKKAETDANH